MTHRERPRLLMVDDIKANINILMRDLEPEYDIEYKKDGESALKSARSSPPDLILLDIIMPGMDGYEVCRRLKASPLTRETPVIFITSMNDENDETKGFDLGAVDYITKPFSLPIVRARLKTHMKIRRLIGELREALCNVKKLSGLLPICANCKKIRDDQGYWNRIEKYIHEHSEATFTHAICPECVEDLNLNAISKIIEVDPDHQGRRGPRSP
ncbi:MAG: response regulator [Desulfobacterales bacterium]|nr:response regulator [Desulfobacterales bacterium]